MKKLIVNRFFVFFILHSQSGKVSQDWTSFNQTMMFKLQHQKKFKVVAFVKSIQRSKCLGRYLGRVDTKDDERGFDNMGDGLLKSMKWQSTVEGLTRIQNL
jgi:hypothetical protein